MRRLFVVAATALMFATAQTQASDNPSSPIGLWRTNGEYGGGDILDPNTGSIDRCSFKLENEGRTLVVRGYLGVSLFGRTQKWLREPG